MAKINNFNISTCLTELSETEKEFLKDIIKNGDEYDRFSRAEYDHNGIFRKEWRFVGYFLIYDNLEMLQVIWKKMKKIRATHIISYLPTPYDGDILLINERYANDFEQWAKKSGASEQEAKAYAEWSKNDTENTSTYI